MTDPTKRIQLDLGPKNYARLLWLKQELEAGTYAEVVRNALKLYESTVRQRIAERDEEDSLFAFCPLTKSEDGGSCGTQIPCNGKRHPNGAVVRGCGEPCSFVMGKC